MTSTDVVPLSFIRKKILFVFAAHPKTNLHFQKIQTLNSIFQNLFECAVSSINLSSFANFLAGFFSFFFVSDSLPQSGKGN